DALDRVLHRPVSAGAREVLGATDEQGEPGTDLGRVFDDRNASHKLRLTAIVPVETTQICGDLVPLDVAIGLDLNLPYRLDRTVAAGFSPCSGTGGNVTFRQIPPNAG